MLIDILLIILGAVLVLWGAARLTDGAVALAERMGIPQIIIGLTIVAIGTSMPEFSVSLVSALHHSPGLAVGNIVGSNIFNALLIVGVAALVSPITITRSSVKCDIPVTIAASAVLCALAADGNISRLDAAILLAMFALFLWVSLRGAKTDGEAESAGGKRPRIKAWKAAALVVIGLAALVAGSNVFVKGASAVAMALGVSEAVIGLTIVAGGTSLPELATSVVAARRGDSGIAIGNVLGSNAFNILMILGATGAICPMPTAGVTMADMLVMLGSMVALWAFSYTKMRIQRWEGGVLVAAFAVYLAYLLYNI